MIRKPLQRKAKRGYATSQTTTIKAPVRGWRSDESRVATQEGGAIELINWVPEPDAIRIRKGYASHATGMTGEVETLMDWHGPASSEIFACVDEKIYDVTGTGAVGAAAVSSLNSNVWSYVNFTTSGGHFLVCANGADSVRNYDGTSWTTPTITGVTSSTLDYVWSHKTRIWFIEENTTSAWYLGTSSISGAATEFPLGAVFTKGGKLIAGASWSVDAGQGMDDLNVFLSSEGEALVYSMSDPADPTTLTLIGVYYVGKPIGRRPFFKLGGELLILTYGGIVPLSAALKTSDVLLEEKAISSPIRPDFADLTAAYGSNVGWAIEAHPSSNILIVNVPVAANSIYVQVIVNVLTGAWAKWEGINSVCWLEHDGTIYFGGTSGVVWTAETGSADDSAAITASVLPAFSYLGHKGRIKDVKMVRPLIESNMDATASITVATDYQDAPEASGTQTAQSGGFTWDSSVWDGDDLWIGTVISRKWRTGSNTGTAISPFLGVTITSASSAEELTYRLFGFDVVYETGGIL